MGHAWSCGASSAGSALQLDLAEERLCAHLELVWRRIVVRGVPHAVALHHSIVIEAGDEAIDVDTDADVARHAEDQLADGELRIEREVTRPRAPELEVHHPDAAMNADLVGIRVGEMHGEEVRRADVDREVAHAR